MPPLHVVPHVKINFVVTCISQTHLRAFQKSHCDRILYASLNTSPFLSFP